MKIIQSYKQLNEIRPELNFYPFLLSFLTLKKYYNFDVIMFCDSDSYNFIKYIPYDKIVILPKDINYKLNILKNIKVEETFIYVEPTISIFSNIFDNYISNKYDILVKCVSQKISLGPSFFVNKNKKFLYDNNICKNYNEKYFDTDIIGMNYNFKHKYIENVNKIINSMDALNGTYIYYKDLILDELTTYLTYINNNFSCYKIINDNDLINLLNKEIFIKYNYAYFNRFNVNDIKNEIKLNFKNNFNLIEAYENNL